MCIIKVNMLPIEFVLSCTKVWEFNNLPWNSLIEKIITFWCNGIYSRKIIVRWTLLMVNPQHLVIKYVHKKRCFATFKDRWHVHLKVSKIWNSFCDNVDSVLISWSFSSRFAIYPSPRSSNLSWLTKLWMPCLPFH